MSQKPEALADRLDDERMNLIERLADENERLRELLTEAAAIEPDCGCVGCSDKREALKVRINAALRREDV